MQDFRVTLNSTTNVFLANSEVTGTVYLKTEEAIKARKIDVKVSGKAKTSFNIPRGQYSQYYSSTQTFIETETILWTPQDESNKIAAGCYEFPFKFLIPINCPPNVSKLYGNIKYFVKASIDVPWSFDKKFIVGFSVIPYMDLNIDSRLASPVINYLEKTGLFSSKAVKVTLKMPKMGYVCGEVIAFNVSIENESSSEVKSVESYLEATYSMTASDNMPIESIRTSVTKKQTKKYCAETIPLFIEVGKSSVYTRTIEIPPVPPSFDHCEIIKLNYHVYVKVHTSAIFSRGASALLPIVIGTIPIRQDSSVTEPDFVANEAYMQPPPPGIPPPGYDFTEANFKEGDVDEEKSQVKEEEEDDSFSFQPKFAYYSDLKRLLNPRH